MKKLCLSLLFLILLVNNDIFAQVGVNTSTPKTTLEVVGDPNSATAPDGVMVPKITLAQLKAKDAAYSADQNTAMVYVTDITGGSTAKTADITTTGFYYYNATTSKWAAVANGGTGPSLQLNVAKNASQGVAEGSVVIFETANTGTLTGGNTWDANTSIFTVGASGAGLYTIDVKLASSGVVRPAIDFGGGYFSPTTVMGDADYINTNGGSQNDPARGHMSTTLYLAAGASFNVAAGGSIIHLLFFGPSAMALNGDASCQLTVVKLN